MKPQPEHKPKSAPQDMTGNQPALNRAQIAATAQALLETGGFDAFSMRKLAASLGVRPPSLYWHVRSKDDLFNLITDNILGECRLPPPAEPEQWKDSLAAASREFRRVLLTHPACGRLFTGRIPLGPNGLRLAEYTIATLRRAGFDRRTASYAYVAIAIYTTGFAAHELSFGQGPEARRRLREMADHLRDLPADRFPNLAEAADDIISPGLTDRYELGLASILNGLGQPSPPDTAAHPTGGRPPQRSVSSGTDIS